MKTLIIICIVAFLLPMIVQSEGQRLSKRFHPFATAKRMSQNLKRHISDIRRNRREAASSIQKCLDAVQQAQSSRFTTCENEIEPYEDEDNIPSSVIEAFCGQNCGEFMADVGYNLAEYCPGGNTDDINQSDLAILRGSCHTDPLHHYCVADWQSLKTEECLASVSDQSHCGNACSKATTWVTKNLGCCYSYLFLFTGTGSSLLPENAFTACKLEFPKQC